MLDYGLLNPADKAEFLQEAADRADSIQMVFNDGDSWRTKARAMFEAAHQSSQTAFEEFLEGEDGVVIEPTTYDLFQKQINLLLIQRYQVSTRDPEPVANPAPAAISTGERFFQELATETVNHWTVDYPAAFPDHQRENLRLAIKRSLMTAYGEGRRDADRDAGRDQE